MQMSVAKIMTENVQFLNSNHVHKLYKWWSKLNYENIFRLGRVVMLFLFIIAEMMFNNISRKYAIQIEIQQIHGQTSAFYRI